MKDLHLFSQFRKLGEDTGLVKNTVAKDVWLKFCTGLLTDFIKEYDGLNSLRTTKRKVELQQEKI